MRTGSLLVAFLTATAIASRIGDDAVAAHQIAFQVLLFLALSLDAIAIAGQAIVGRSLGARRRTAPGPRPAACIEWGVGRRRRLRRSRSWSPGRCSRALFTDDAGRARPRARRSSGSSPRCNRWRRSCSCSTACSSARATRATSRWRWWARPSALPPRRASLVAALDAGSARAVGRLVAVGCSPASSAWWRGLAPTPAGDRSPSAGPTVAVSVTDPATATPSCVAGGPPTDADVADPIDARRRARSRPTPGSSPTPTTDARHRADASRRSTSTLGPQRDAPRPHPHALRPDLPLLVPRRVGRPRAPPARQAARCSSPTTPARSRRTRR